MNDPSQIRPTTASGDDTLRVGIVGGGMIAINHAKALQAIPGVPVTAVADIDATSAKRFAGTHESRAITPTSTR